MGAYCVEYNRSRFQTWPKCKCKQRIEEGDLRWGSHDKDDWSLDGHTYWSHLACVSHRVFQNAVLAHGSLAAIPGAVEYDLLDELEIVCTTTCPWSISILVTISHLFRLS